MLNLKKYLVGGAIRDKLLGLKINERDWLIIGSSFKIMLNLNFKLVGKDFPVFLHPISKEEYALARKDKKISKGYSGFKCFFSNSVTLKEDLFRRDLSINAITLDKHGCLIDFFSGFLDLKKKYFFCVSYAFSEDPLRVLRVARFFTKYYYLNFIISPCTFILMRDLVYKGEMRFLVSERILKEIHSTLRYGDSILFFYVLYTCGVLRVIFYDLYLFFLFSNIYKFNFFLNLSNQFGRILYIFANKSSNFFLRFSVFFYRLFFKKFIFYFNSYDALYDKYNFLIVEYYKNKFNLSKKYCKFFNYLNFFYSTYYNLKFLSNVYIHFILNKINAYKDKVKFTNILLMCDLILKVSNKLNKFYKKYFILDILNEICFLKLFIYKKNASSNFFYKRISFIIDKYKKVYNEFYFI